MAERKRRRKGGGRSSKVAARQSSSIGFTPFIERNIPYFEILSEEGLALIENNAEILLEEIGVDFRDFPEVLECTFWRISPLLQSFQCPAVVATPKVRPGHKDKQFRCGRSSRLPQAI